MLDYKFDNRKIISARVESGLKQSDIAKRMGIARQTYSAKENGKRSFTIEELLLISKITSKPAEYFFRGYVTESRQEIV